MPVHAKLKTEDRQAELIQAALGLAAQRSPAEVTTADLAREVGITQGAVFRHFTSKESIWLAVLDWAHRALMTRLTVAAQDSPGDASAALRAVFMAHIDFVQQHPGVPRLVFQELQHAKPTPLQAKVQALMAEYRLLISGLLLRAKGEGLMAPEVDLQAAAVLFMGAVQGLVMQSLISGQLQEMTRQAVAVFSIYEAGLRTWSQSLAEERT